MKRYQYADGYFLEIGDRQWQEWQHGVRAYTFDEQSRSAESITIHHPSRNITVFLPRHDGMCWIKFNSNAQWADLYPVDCIEHRLDDPFLENADKKYGNQDEQIITGTFAKWGKSGSGNKTTNQHGFGWCDTPRDQIKNPSSTHLGTSTPFYNLVGQIFFATGSCYLDQDDATQLQKIYNHYRRALQVHSVIPQPPVIFSIYGYANHRNFNQGNDRLSAARAERVQDDLSQPQRLGAYSRYQSAAVGLGVHSGSNKFVGRADLLKQYRHVDIFAPPVVPGSIPPTSPPSKKSLPLYAHWRARIEKGVSTSAIIL